MWYKKLLRPASYAANDLKHLSTMEAALVPLVRTRLLQVGSLYSIRRRGRSFKSPGLDTTNISPFAHEWQLPAACVHGANKVRN